MTTVYTKSQFEDLIDTIKKEKKFVIGHLWIPEENVGGLSISVSKEGFYLPIFHFLEKFPLDAVDVIHSLFELFSDSSIRVITFDAFDTFFFLRNNGLRVNGTMESALLLLHLMNEEEDLIKLALDFDESDYSTKMKEFIECKTVDSISDFFVATTNLTLKVRNHFKKKLTESQTELYNRENEILKIYINMSFSGVNVNTNILKENGSGFVKDVEHKSCIRTHYNMITSTGRVYSSKPNLQNIQKGSPVLNAFVPPEGFAIVSMDYSQIELRILAYYSEDPVLNEAISSGKDIHSLTASLIFNKEEISEDERRVGKIVNFAILYGASLRGLEENIKKSCNLSISCKKLISSLYKKHYKEVGTFQKDVTEVLKEEGGYISNLFGRRGFFPEKEEDTQSSFRKAFNFVIQSTAADIFKLAMVEIDIFFQKRHTKTKMVLQMHDEIIFYWSLDELNLISKVQKVMENIFPDIPMKVNISWSEKSLGDMKPFVMT